MRFLRRCRPARAVKPASRFRPQLEALEDRCVPSSFAVTNLSGDPNAVGSLPYEVNLANGSGTPATITFTPGLSGTIPLAATLVLNNSTSHDITIDGSGANITVSGQGSVEDFYINSTQNATINALTITGGSMSGQFGGGIHNSGDLLLTNCTVTGNSAPSGAGGGIYSIGPLLMINDTVTGNSAKYGGGIYNEITMTLINCTVANNTVTGAGADGGGIYINNNVATTTNLLNTIVYNPNSGAATQDDVHGKITQVQGSLFGTAPTVAVNGDLGSNQYSTNPLLGPLQNNGGATQTMALQAGSPSIGTGVSNSGIGVVPTTDQIGDPRPANSIDIGAFQTQTQPPPPPSPQPTSISLTQVLVTPTLSSEAVTLTAQVSSAGGPVNEGTVTFSLAGQMATAPVNAKGQATTQLGLPALTTATPLTIGVSYSDNGTAFAASTTSDSARFIATDALMPSTSKVSAGGGQTITDVLFGLLSLSRSYDAQGRLTEVDLDGIPLETFGYNAQGQLTTVGLMGVQMPLPFGLPPQLADVLFQDSLGLPLVV
jgi:YD repeat-containing protein